MVNVIINFNLTKDNCTNFLRGVAIYKGQIKSNYSLAKVKDLENIKSVSSCSCDYFVQFPNMLILEKFKQKYPEFHYEEKENPVVFSL